MPGAVWPKRCGTGFQPVLSSLTKGATRADCAFATDQLAWETAEVRFQDKFLPPIGDTQGN